MLNFPGWSKKVQRMDRIGSRGNVQHWQKLEWPDGNCLAFDNVNSASHTNSEVPYYFPVNSPLINRGRNTANFYRRNIGHPPR